MRSLEEEEEILTERTGETMSVTFSHFRGKVVESKTLERQSQVDSQIHTTVKEEAKEEQDSSDDDD